MGGHSPWQAKPSSPSSATSSTTPTCASRPSGAAVANFRIASTPRTFDRQTNEWKDGEALFLRCAVWRQAAENVAESLQRGMRVIVQGRLKSRSYETREGEKRTVFEIDVDEVGPSLRCATAKVTRASRSGGGGGQPGGYSGGGQSGGGRGQPGGGSDPWASGGSGRWRPAQAAVRQRPVGRASRWLRRPTVLIRASADVTDHHIHIDHSDADASGS